MKSKFITIILVLCLSASAGAEGLLPSLTNTIGMPMPSLGEALTRYPDEEVSGSDGSNTEVFRSVTESDFNTFSVYLQEKDATLDNYQATGSSFSASIQIDGNTITFNYDTEIMEARVKYPKGTYDEWLEYAKLQYKSALHILDEGKINEAMSVLDTIPNYSEYRPFTESWKDHLEHAKAIRNERLAPYRKVGGYITFGNYEQDNITANGKESIKWQVLDYDAGNNRTLLISQYGLDAKPYNLEGDNTTWEDCTLRAWLNNEFMNNAFSISEQDAILTTTVDNRTSQGYSTWMLGGGKTEDRIFLLSYMEANKYFGVTLTDDTNMKSRISPTNYAVSAGTRKKSSNRVTGWWWLRSPGIFPWESSCVSDNGDLESESVNKVNGCVRPALWIDLDSDIF